ncbi:ATP phosphoribosyltransferase [Halanaerobaculum tunisiense]
MNKLRVALPKGRMFSTAVDILRKADLVHRELDDDSRKLVLPDPSGEVEFILSKAVDVQTYVEHGVADIGIAGKDILLEAEADVYEVADLEFGSCRLVVALPEDKGVTSLAELPLTGRVATKYTNVAQKFFTQRGFQVELVKLNGSIELAPLIGLADMIVDISSTGTTLRENNLVEIAEIARSSARLIVNQVSYKTEDKRIREIVDRVKKVVKSRN